MLKAIHLEPIPFDMERDLVTPTFKLKRPQLLKYYKVRSTTCHGFHVFFLPEELLFWQECLVYGILLLTPNLFYAAWISSSNDKQFLLQANIDELYQEAKGTKA